MKHGLKVAIVGGHSVMQSRVKSYIIITLKCVYVKRAIQYKLVTLDRADESYRVCIVPWRLEACGCVLNVCATVLIDP